jgi:hypothetical protein
MKTRISRSMVTTRQIICTTPLQCGFQHSLTALCGLSLTSQTPPRDAARPTTRHQNVFPLHTVPARAATCMHIISVHHTTITTTT